MKTMRKLAVLTLAGTMFASTLAMGAFADEASDPIPVTLVMFGEESQRMKELMANEIHQKVLDEINVDLEIQYLPWSEYGGGKSELMFSAGEKFMCYTNTEVTAKMVGKGYYADVTDLLEENAPELYEYCNEAEASEAFKINDRIYSITVGNKPNAGENYLMMVRKDLMEEVGVEEINTIEDLENFYTLCKEIHPDYIGLGRGLDPRVLNGSIASEKNMDFVNNFVFTDANADDTTLYSYYESEEFKQVAEIAARWKEMGIIPSYQLSNGEQSSSEFAAGRAMFAVSANDRIFEMMETVRPSAPDALFVNVYLGNEEEKPLLNFGAGNYVTAFGISAGVEDPEELAAYIQVINLFQKNQEWVDRWVYGIEDVDYTLTENGRVERICTDELIHSWMPVNVNFRRYPSYVTDEQIEAFNHQADNAIDKKTMNFIFDTEPVKSEYAQLQAVESEYLTPIANGFKDYDENIDKAIEKLKAAGIDKFMEEVQRQFDEFKASQQ